MFVFTITAIIIGLICWIISLITYRIKNDTEPAKNFKWLTFFTGLWLLSNAFLDLSKSYTTVIALNSILTLAVCMICYYFTFFIESFIAPQKPIQKIKKVIFVCISLLFILGSFTPLGFKNIQIFDNKPVTEDLGIMWTIFFIIFILVLINGLHKLSRKIHSSTGVVKLQAIYIFIGFIIGMVSGIIFDIILPLIGKTQYYSLGYQFTIFFIICSLYAIYKHQLLDIKIVIQKSIIYSVLIVFISSIYLFILFSVLYFYPYNSPITYSLAAMITTVAGIFSIPQLEKYFKKVTDKIFFKNKYDFPQVIDQLTNILNNNFNLHELTTLLEEALKKILKVDNVCFVIINKNVLFHNTKKIELWQYLDDTILISNTSNSNNQKTYTNLNNLTPLQQIQIKKITFHSYFQDFEIFIPIIFKQELNGVIALSEKLSNDPFFQEDIALLTTFAAQFALALERVLLFEQLKEYSQTLEEKIVERTSEIKKMQESQSQMIYDISHELQTPLTIIKGELNSLENNFFEDSKYKSLEKSVDRVSTFISRLLKLAKLDFTNVPIKKIDLSDIINELVEYLNVIAEQKKINITAQITPNIKIWGDKEQLDELVTNLLSNAIKYISNDRKIEINLIQQLNNVVLIIKDSGIGIAKDDIDNLFKRFYRANTAKKIKGTGIGLAICKKITSLHHGTITIESALNKGTTVTVTLPIAK